MPSVTQGEITEDKLTTLEINYQTDFACKKWLIIFKLKL